MTNQEAKEWIEANHFDGDSYGFVDGDDESKAMFLAVKALEKQNKLVEAIHRIEALNPVDYGWMGSYEAHEGAKAMKRDVLDILDDLIEEEE